MAVPQDLWPETIPDLEQQIFKGTLGKVVPTTRPTTSKMRQVVREFYGLPRRSPEKTEAIIARWETRRLFRATGAAMGAARMAGRL